MYNLLLNHFISIICCDCDVDFHATNQNQSSNVFDASSGDLFERSKTRV